MIKDIEDEIDKETSALDIEESPTIKDLEAGGETEIAHLEKVRHRAYLLWQNDGEPEGRDQDYWYRAERELAGE